MLDTHALPSHSLFVKWHCGSCCFNEKLRCYILRAIQENPGRGPERLNDYCVCILARRVRTFAHEETAVEREIASPAKRRYYGHGYPTREDLNLDEKGLERLIEHLIGGGVHGIFILGTTGEAPNLPYEVRSAVIEQACKRVAPACR